MKRFVYNIHDWSSGSIQNKSKLEAVKIGKVIIISRSKKESKQRIIEYIEKLNGNNESEGYYYSKSNIKVIGIIDLEEENTYE